MAGPGVRGREKRPPQFVCNDCKTDFAALARKARDRGKEERQRVIAPIDYMVMGHIWEWAIKQNPPMHTEGTLCIPCLEKRLGRKLHPADFPPYPLPVNVENPVLRERSLV